MLRVKVTSLLSKPSLLTRFHAPWNSSRRLLHCSPIVTCHVTKPSSNLFSPLPRKEIDLSYKPPLAGRKFLPGAQLDGFPEFLPGPQESFPKAYHIERPQEMDIEDWGKACRLHIDEELPKYSAILFRLALSYYMFLWYVGIVSHRRKSQLRITNKMDTLRCNVLLTVCHEFIRTVWAGLTVQWCEKSSNCCCCNALLSCDVFVVFSSHV